MQTVFFQVFSSDDPDSTMLQLNENDLKEALKQYRTLYAAIYRDEATNENEETSTIQLLQVSLNDILEVEMKI